MSDHTRIEWTDTTWNPIRGCTKISPGCAHCYAETFAERFRGVKDHPYEQGFDLRLVPEKLGDPFKWSRPRLDGIRELDEYDLFHEDVPYTYIREAVDVMLQANWHTYQVLTKRSGRLRELLQTRLKDAAAALQIWWGVSVENPARRIAAHPRPAANTSCHSLSVGRAPSGRPRIAGSHRNPLGDRGRRKWSWMPSDQWRVDQGHSRSVPESRRLVFLQTVGWYPQDKSRSIT